MTIHKNTHQSNGDHSHDDRCKLDHNHAEHCKLDHDHDDQCSLEHDHDDQCKLDHRHGDQSLSALCQNSWVESFSIDEHESVKIASISIRKDISYNEALATTKEQLEMISQKVSSAGGVIGHIKASVKGGEGTSTLSTTGDAVNVIQGALGDGSLSDVQINIVALILAIEKEDLQKILEDTLLKSAKLYPNIP